MDSVTAEMKLLMEGGDIDFRRFQEGCEFRRCIQETNSSSIGEAIR